MQVKGTGLKGKDSMGEKIGAKPSLRMITAAVLATVSGLLSAFHFLGHLSAWEMTGLVLATISYLLLGVLFLFETARLLFVYRTWDFDMNQLSHANFWEEVCFYHLPILLISASAAILLAAIPIIKKRRKQAVNIHKNI